ncbi:hypothetical protein ACLOJK_015803 [Asimina triloba]
MKITVSLQKTVIKVAIYCVKCRAQIFKAVAKLTGIDQIVMDAEKGTLTVVGDVDPMQIVCQVKKTGKFQELVSVGPAKSEDKDKKPDQSKKDDDKKKNLPQSCKDCQLIPVTYVYEEGRLCTIL